MANGRNRKIKDSSQVPNVIAVVGPFRSGTSCVAGMLHVLGVSMGQRFMPPLPPNPKGFFEAVNLRHVCQRICQTPLRKDAGLFADASKRVNPLRKHIEFRSGESNPLGVKHPNLCFLVSDMAEAWPGVKIVAVTRDINAVVASMLKSNLLPKRPESELCEAISRMISARGKAIEELQVPCLSLRYPDILDHAQQTVENLISFCGISPTPQQIEEAVAFLDRELCHN